MIAGARLLTGSYVPRTPAPNGPILSRGAMITAAIAKASSARPDRRRQAVAARRCARCGERLGVPPEEIAVVGDDLRLDVALGRLGRSTTVLVRSGISGPLDLDRVPETHRPHAAVETVAELLEWL